jgi:putative ABC transport system permease protein
MPLAPSGLAMLRDIRLAFRLALRNPALTSVIVISLALGIGANTTIFTLINAVFLRRGWPRSSP